MDKVMTEIHDGDFVYVPELDDNNEPLMDRGWVQAQVTIVTPPFVRVKYRGRTRRMEACYHRNQISKDDPFE